MTAIVMPTLAAVREVAAGAADVARQAGCAHYPPTGRVLVTPERFWVESSSPTDADWSAQWTSSDGHMALDLADTEHEDRWML